MCFSSTGGSDPRHHDISVRAISAILSKPMLYPNQALALEPFYRAIDGRPGEARATGDVVLRRPALAGFIISVIGQENQQQLLVCRQIGCLESCQDSADTHSVESARSVSQGGHFAPSGIAWSNTSGLASLRNSTLAWGIPFFRHSDTLAGRISHNCAVLVVPPRRSIIALATSGWSGFISPLF